MKLKLHSHPLIVYFIDYLDGDGRFLIRPHFVNSMKKYLLISHEYSKTRRGAYTTSKRLARSFPEYLDHKVDKDCIGKLEQFNEEYKKLIFVTQAPRMYEFKANFISLRHLNYSYFIRGEFHPKLYKNTISNGFHYYRMYSDINFYVPFIFDFPMQVFSKIDNLPVVGFYIRPVLVPDVLDYAINFARTVRTKIRLYILGECDHRFDKYDNVVSCNQTYDNKEFFSNITHYIYPKSVWFEDPFPNTLLEAVQCNKQICLPKIGRRKHKDGIDDISEVINYQYEFNPGILVDNISNPLTFSNFRKFYLRLFENNFEYEFDRQKYKSFSDWIEYELF